MKFSAKSITLATLVTTSVISSMTFLGNQNQASANNIQTFTPTNYQLNKLGNPAPSVVGNWKGSIGSKGDDALTVVEINISAQAGAVKPGSWKFIGFDSQKNQDIVLQSGSLSATVGNNNSVTLTFKEKGKTLWTFNTKLNNTERISGELVGKPNIQINLKKN
ncbi:hypothetical protein [Nostoc sp. UHCC 0870]|uniref:hypothetical protein n=1 Tax=Nostoc sp. UHCC 0870 TaxID=2914041 RepID=UPI001EDF7309|nr:hypothetical protein [Nostoc sp. UHCC 0870]UKP01555.1 hypothetical protein L6494_30650 [Nostoc sp. UHCC 0870]